MALTIEVTGLEEVEALAQRMKTAVATIREAQALLGGAPFAPNHLGGGTPVTPVAVAPASTIVDLEPEKQRALDDWRNSPERARLLASIRPDEPEVEQ